jgi:hypothetical protein
VDATNIEIKVNIGGDVDSALTALGLGEGKRRKVWFLDDITDGARPPLPLMEAGVVLRLRRRDNGNEESTVKIRPCRRSQLPDPWNVAVDDDKQYRIEGDWSGTRHVLAASCDGAVEPGTIANVTAAQAPVSDLFSERQHDFLAACAEIRVAPSGLTVLKEIDARQWKDFSVGQVPHVDAERWRVAGLDFLELSLRVSGPADAAAQQQSLTDEVLAMGLKLDDSKEPKTARVMKRLAGME